MLKTFFFFGLFSFVLCGCNQTDDLALLEMAAPGDEFARNFIEKIAKGETDSAYAKLDSELQSDDALSFLKSTGEKIETLDLADFKIVEQRVETRTETKTGRVKLYSLGYEYVFEEGVVLFLMMLSETDKRTEVTSFNVEYLPEPLSRLTAFHFNDKSVLHYLFLFFGVAVPFFIITTMIAMLRSEMTVRKKLLWTLLILLVNMPQFSINWVTSDVDFSTFSISLFGFGITRPALYLPWIFSFSLPLGAAGYWFQAGSSDAFVEISRASDKRN